MFILAVESLAEVVKNDRLARGMSQDEYAALLEVNGQTVSNIETGVTKSMKLKPMRRLADLVQRPVSELIAIAKGGDIETIGPAPIYSPKTLREMPDWVHHGKPMSRDAQDEYDRVEEKIRAMRGKAQQGRMGGI